MKNWKGSILLCIGLSLSLAVDAEQKVSEGQRAKAAEQFYLAKKYAQAADLYAQLVSVNPKNYKYNYYYGICLLITASDKTAAIPYLEKAIQHPKTPEDIYYYLGRAYHLSYHFDEAIRAYSEMKSIVGDKDAGRWRTHELLNMAGNARLILDTTLLSTVVSKTTASSNEFFSLYPESPETGKMLVMPDELLESSGNKEAEEKPVIFLSGNGLVMYYTAFSTVTDSRDIYRVDKDRDGTWGQPTRLTQQVNSEKDELLPTCNYDGSVLYFSSRGWNTTGGFDLFKARYTAADASWSAPENLGSPFNSPDDDYCFIGYSQTQTAWFCSQRETTPGTVTVYSAAYTSRDASPIAIRGKVSCFGCEELGPFRITITQAGNPNPIAELSTDPSTLGYETLLPGFGTYQFLVESPGIESLVEELTFPEYGETSYVQDLYISQLVHGKLDLAITNRTQKEMDLLEASMTAYAGQHSHDGTFSTGEVKAMDGFGSTSSTAGTPADASTSGSTDKPADPTEKFHASSLEGIEYRVQIGAFFKNTRDIVKGRLEKKTNKEMLSDYNDKTYLRFFMGHENTYTSAKNLRESLRMAGFSDAFVVAFKDGQPLANVRMALDLIAVAAVE